MIRQAKRALGRTPLARLYRNTRLVRAYRGFQRNPIASARFVLFNREMDNFTYELANTGELARVIAAAVAIDTEQVRRVLAEIVDEPIGRKAGRRLGWYAVARLRRPELIVETGVHDGLGSTILLTALERNAAEGYEGRLLAFDVRADVGWLVPDGLRNRYDLRIGDTATELAPAISGERVGMFIHDSAHTYEHEMFELEAVWPNTVPGAALVSDNAHGTPAFTDFCERHGFRPFIFHERPRRHMYPGAALGLAVTPCKP